MGQSRVTEEVTVGETIVLILKRNLGEEERASTLSDRLFPSRVYARQYNEMNVGPSETALMRPIVI